jgi:hypothetical protein
MPKSDDERGKIDEFLRQAKALTLHKPGQRLYAGSAILQAASLLALNLLAADCKQLGDDLGTMHPGKFTQDIEALQQAYAEMRDKIEDLVGVHHDLVDRLIALMPEGNRDTMHEIFRDTETKVREIVLLGMRSALDARNLFSDEGEFDRLTRSDTVH